MKRRNGITLNRKGVELTTNTIIIITLLTVLMLILLYMLFRSNTTLGRGTGCEGLGGECRPDSCEGLEGYVRSPNSCPTPGDVCCLPLLKSDNG